MSDGLITRQELGQELKEEIDSKLGKTGGTLTGDLTLESNGYLKLKGSGDRIVEAIDEETNKREGYLGFIKSSSPRVTLLNNVSGLALNLLHDGRLMYGNNSILTDKPVTWVNAALQNGWVGSFFYRKNAVGQLEISFSVASGVVTSLTAICELPMGYRPRYGSICSIVETTTGAVVAGAIVINNMGRVFVSLNAPIKTGIAYTSSIVLPT